MIVEKSHVVKFLIKSVAGSIRICAAILLCILAVIGLTALIYPEVRRELLQVLSEILMEGQKMIRMGEKNPGVQMDTWYQNRKGGKPKWKQKKIIW